MSNHDDFQLDPRGILKRESLAPLPISTRAKREGKASVFARAGKGKVHAFAARNLQPQGGMAKVLPRSQRVFIKADAVGRATRNWGKYGRDYLSREGVGKENEEGKGFGRDGEVDLGEVMESWEKAGDDYHYHVVISPENSTVDIDQSFVRELMSRAEKELGQQFEWGAIVHHNTETQHVHMVIRGRDEQGRNIAIGHYFSKGMTLHAEELATNRAGYRLPEYDLQRRDLTIDREAWTATDKALWKRRDTQNRVHLEPEQDAYAGQRARQERQRLAYLEEKGLVTKRGKDEWELQQDFKKELQFRGPNREFAPDWWQKEAPAKEQDRATQERQRTMRTIDEDERNRGMER